MILTFKLDNSFGDREAGTKVTYESTAVTLGDVLEDFSCALKAMGYHFDGELEIVEEDDTPLIDDEFERLQGLVDQQFDEIQRLRTIVLRYEAEEGLGEGSEKSDI